MKKTYKAPTLVKRDTLGKVTASDICLVSNCIDGIPKKNAP